MSLQAVINPLEFMKKITGFDGSRSLGEVTRQRTNTPLNPGMLDYEAMMKKRVGQGAFSGMGGFDASDLMKTPGMVQQSTRDQAEKVSAPYREANIMAADKTNPMNAASQDPGKTFLMDYINNPGERILIPKR